MLDTIRHAMANLKATLSKTLDMPPTKTASHDVDAALVPIEKELQQALAALQKFAAEKEKPVHATDLRAARETLGHVDSLYHEGAIVIPGVEGVPAGQAKLSEMLAQGHELLRTILENQVDFYKVDAALRPTHDKLDNVLHALRSIQDKADLQPHDLRPYRQKLAEIDAHYTQAGVEVDGKFPEGQAVVAGMLNESHELVRQMLMKCDYYKVAPELMSVHDRLEFIIMRLEGLLRKENLKEADLGNLRDKLSAVDAEWKEGKMGATGGQVPEGQAVVSELLNKAHELMAQVQNKL